MTAAVLLDAGLAVLVLVLAGWVVFARAAFTAAIVFVVYGLLVSLVWVRLSAIDVALTEAAIGSGVTGMLLLGAAARLRQSEPTAEMGLPARLAAGALSAVIAAGLAAVMLFPPENAPTLAPSAMAHLAQSGLGNPVAGVLFVYRAFDTLLEKVVLLLALVGVWSLAHDRAWGGAPALLVRLQPSGALTLLAQVLPPIGIMFGIYMFWTGASRPGGAFQGGTVLAAMWLLVMIAGLQRVPPIGLRSVRLMLVVGPAIFLAIGLAGFVLAGAFLAYPASFAKPLIVVAEATLTLSIGVTLGLLAAGPPERMPQP
ncbi:MAG TPA: hydrogenase subunit MbhD domain-containing protein [Xanthobacteraceae bacterium]|jgi:multisubunit Na+/H+ antiporter MnhB subunit|nr:hydrogenase subunit MbhD domain-containing protein [Xanthobacteraceae bacterium]